jgi:hypothetical protein
MAVLKNPRHEKFAHAITGGLSATEAYIYAGYSKCGARQGGSRLLTNVDVCSRVAELRQALSQNFIQLKITERDERLKALQHRWDAVREAMAARGAGDYVRMMATGVVARKVRRIGSGAFSKEVEEYEIDTGAIEALNSIERRAGIETGQEVEKRDISITADIHQLSVSLGKTLTPAEAETIRLTLMAAQKRALAPAAVVEVQQVEENRDTR